MGTSGGEGGFLRLVTAPSTLTTRVNGPSDLRTCRPARAIGHPCLSSTSKAPLAHGDPSCSHTHCRQACGTEALLASLQHLSKHKVLWHVVGRDSRCLLPI